MCLITFFLTSPLEQFEISAFTSNLKIIETSLFENFEFKYYSQILFNTQSILLFSLFFISILILLQNFYHIKGIFNIIILTYTLTIGINIYSFNDFINQNSIILSFQPEKFLTDPFILSIVNFIYPFENPIII